MSGNGSSNFCFIDSNVWLYRFIVNPDDPNAVKKQQLATTVTSREGIFISTQIINEVCSNLIRKAQADESQIRKLIDEFEMGCEVTAVSLETIKIACEVRAEYLISFWDSLIVAAALQAGVGTLYSEDMQDGLRVNNQLKIINPFK